MLVSISDKHGKPVSVAPSDLTLLVDRAPVPISELKPANDVPLRFLVLVDLSNSNRDKVDFERKSAAELFEALSKNVNSSGYLGWFSLQTHISTHPISAADATQWLQRATAAGPTALYDAIAYACAHTLHRDDGAQARRVVFLVSDGEDNQSHISASDAVQAAQREGVPIFTLGMLSSFPRRTGGAVLKKLAKETGGNAVLLEGPGRFLDKLLLPLNTQYILTFNPGPGQAGGDREVELKSSDHKLEVLSPPRFATE